MTDELDALIDGATGGEPAGDAGASIISPEMLEQVRASGANRRPPKVARPVEAPIVDGEDDDNELEPAPRPRSRGKFAGYRKHEVEAEAERLAQEVEDLRAQQAAQEKVVDPSAIRDLAYTIQFAAQMGFGTAAMLRGPHWSLTQAEGENIGEKGAIALAPLAAEYAYLLPWINFAASLGAPIATRIAEDRRIAKLEQEPNDAA